MKTPHLITKSIKDPSVRHGFILISLAAAWFVFSPAVRAADGGLPNDNTAEGDGALASLTTGTSNTAIGEGALGINTEGNGNTAAGSEALASNTKGSNNAASGFFSLFNNTTGTDNTANGTSTLFNNTTGNNNTASGANALFSNTTGHSNTATGFNALYNNNADNNTATGVNALHDNMTGSENTATGGGALHFNATGFDNTASGYRALYKNTTGAGNTATGHEALFSNTKGESNTAIGSSALSFNTSGDSNTAIGLKALLESNGNSNTAVGNFALFTLKTGVDNIAIGFAAGQNLTSGDNNIDIYDGGVFGESNTIHIGTEGVQSTTYIAGIYGATLASGDVVHIDSTGHLGTVASSARFKEAIKPMDKASEAILALKPVTFHYKRELDPNSIPQFGLVAEEVEKVNPDLVSHDAKGQVYTVRYEAVNAMLLNEFLKEHRKVEKQEATIEQQQKEITALAAQLKEQATLIQKVSNQLEASKLAPQLVANNY